MKKSQTEQNAVSQDTNTNHTSDSSSTASTGVEATIMYRSPETSMIPIGTCVQSPKPNEPGFMTEMPMNVWTALYLNGSMMGLGCSTSYPAKSKPAGPNIPESLHPTPLQMIAIHPLWIDKFPFPVMRDNLISAIGLVEEEDFLHDLFCMNSFEIKPGGATWDPNSWIIQKGFYDKWGFLFTNPTQ
jgi:Domain of unknown function (DUF3425)